ncbi:MAG: helix-turn-helix domain-containing protein [Planctomycetes bacterium]|nr:helix-turn-helix domain-containing protein [Planctomycetota bacterium]
MSIPAALERGLHVLSILAQDSNGLSFSKIADTLQTSNASTMRLLQSLCELGYVRKLNDNQGYRNTLKVEQLTGTRNIRQLFKTNAEGFLTSLAQRTGNTAISIHWSGTFMVCLDRIMHEDASPLQEPGHVAENLHLSPWGWLFQPLPWWQQQPATSISSNNKGYALKKREIIENIKLLPERGFTYLPGPERRRLAAPVYYQKNIIGALCLGGNIFTLPDNEIYHYGNILAKSAQACSDQMK